jgi:hypothetical protein
MRFISKIWLGLVTAALLNSAVMAASFTATLDRDALTLGETATLTLTFEGGQPKNIPVPQVADINFGHPSKNFRQNIDINAGQVNTTLVLAFPVTPQRTGEFTIPALTAEVGGQQLATAPLKLIVSKASAPTAAAVNSGNEIAFLKLNFPKPKVFTGESAVAQLELYLRDDVSGLNGFQLTSSPTDGFSGGKMVELKNQYRRVQVGNRIYTIVPLALPLTVVKTGVLALGPFTANAVLVLPNGFFGEQRQVALATEAVSIESLPLPAENRPANFSGAVGQFDLAASAGPTSVTVGDPITVRVQISGRGALDGVTLPTQDAWQNFKTYPPTTKLETTDQFGFQGTKTFEQIISPLNNDVHEIPPLNFSYFDPNDGQYHALAQPATPLTVKAAGATPLPQITATKAEEKPAQDILPIKENIGTLSPNKIPFVAQPVFLAAQTVPVLAFLAAFIWRKRADSLANNPRLRRQRAVAALIAAGKSDLKKFAAENKPDEFFATLFRLLQEQLGERLDCPATAITENVIDEHTVLRGTPTATRDGLRELFQLCNQARYAPVRGSAELNSVAARFEKTVGELQEVKV